jgi:DNA polymerase
MTFLQDLLESGVEVLPRAERAAQTPAAGGAGSIPLSSPMGRAAEPVVPGPLHDSTPATQVAVAKGVLFDMTESTSGPAAGLDVKSTAPTLEILADEVAGCTLCTELAATRTQTVFADGNPGARLVFLGEAPGADEDAQGKPFVGRAGKLLTDIIERGMKLRRSDVYIMNVLKCRPPGNRTPLPHEAHSCRPYLLRQLELVDPEFICCLGAVAAQNLLQTTQSIGKMRGQFYPWRGVQVICTYHPAYLLRNPAAKRQTWDDVQMLMRAMGLG